MEKQEKRAVLCPKTHINRGLPLAFAIMSMAVAGLAQTPTPFASVNQPIGIAATSTKLLVVSGWQTGVAPTIMAINSAGAATPFGTLPNPTAPNQLEDYIAIPSGSGCFPAGNVYVTQGNAVYVLPPTGGAATLFATLPTPPLLNGGAGITFDRVGSFGFDMIVTTSSTSVTTSGYVFG